MSCHSRAWTRYPYHRSLLLASCLIIVDSAFFILTRLQWHHIRFALLFIQGHVTGFSSIYYKATRWACLATSFLLIQQEIYLPLATCKPSPKKIKWTEKCYISRPGYNITTLGTGIKPSKPSNHGTRNQGIATRNFGFLKRTIMYYL